MPPTPVARRSHAPPRPTWFAGKAESPFAILTPGWLPDGARLDRVAYGTQQIEGEAARQQAAVFSIDVWYALADGSRLHLWQTDNQLLALDQQDPTSHPSGRPVVAADGRTWTSVEVERAGRPLTEWSRRFGRLTVAIDGVDREVVARVAASLRAP